MKPLCLTAGLFAFLASVTGAHASPYSELLVFGDSLSDVGNTSAWTFGVAPGSDYYEGRFSNGPVYAERLSEGLGLGPLTRDGLGGNGYAYGGAETDGPGGFEGLFLNSLVEQVDAYLDRLDGAPPAADALHVVFIGANDFLRAGQTDVAIPAGVVQGQLDRLVAAGAENFLGVTLPLLGLTPDHNGSPAGAATMNDRTRAYNAALEAIYRRTEVANPGVTIHRLDLEPLLADLVADPGPLGFTDVTTPGQGAAGTSLDRAAGYLFWDGVHPTRQTHALLGEAAIRAVLPAGDYGRDGLLDAADYDAWSDAYGVAFNARLDQTPSLASDGNGDGRVDAADYTLWRDLLGAQSPVGVPEPTVAALLLSGLTVVSGFRVR